MVRNDWANWRWYMGWIVLNCCAIFFGLQLLSALQHYSPFASPAITAGYLAGLMMIAVCILTAIFITVQGRRWKWMNYRRQMAAAWGFAAHVPLATPYPLPNVMALPIPFTIKLKLHWPMVFAYCCWLVGWVLLLYTYFYTYFTFQIGGGFQPGLALSIEIVIPQILSMIYRQAPQQIEIAPDGLTVVRTVRLRSGKVWRFGSRAIRWHEARLFAIRGGKPGKAAIRYELSSPFIVVQWERVRRGRWWSLYRPAIPFAEYDAQMEALTALISGMTGLPLYDVR